MSSRERRTTLFVRGFGPNVRARDLAYEFERFGRLVRCDIPAPKSARSLPFAFVEFEDYRDADDAYRSMHGKTIDGDQIDVEYAKNRPLSTWRYEGRARSRSRSPPRRRSHTPPRGPPCAITEIDRRRARGMRLLATKAHPRPIGPIAVPGMTKQPKTRTIIFLDGVPPVANTLVHLRRKAGAGSRLWTRMQAASHVLKRWNMAAV
ncbi:hypothetical protein SpCBS45565_g08353 [Spizellomyces sp. 'palustris']|nr:hypothetical protein SpCBS45565_g08353 [Spizellomyces sp. 'palustris']